MKKVISFLSAVALIASTFVAMTTIASAENEVALRYDVVYDNTETPYVAGATGTINFYCDNAELISMDDMDTYFSGITTVGITATLDTEYLTSKKLWVTSPALTGSTRNYNEGMCTVQFATTDYDAMVYNMDKALFAIKFTIAKELTAPVEVALSGCNLWVERFDEDGNNIGKTVYGQAGVSSDVELVVPALTVGPAASDDDDDEEEITVKNETVTEYTGEKTLIYVAKVLQKADANKKVVLTKNGEAQNSYRTLAEILGGVAAPGGTLSGDVAIGVLTNDTTATFGFELVD